MTANGRGRPAEGALKTPTRSPVRIQDGGDPRGDLRAGNVLRVVESRVVTCVCGDCGGTFTSTGPAASHSRAKRHRILVDYRTVFTYEPAERRAATP